MLNDIDEQTILLVTALLLAPLAALHAADLVAGQLANGPQILPPGPFDQTGELHVLDHAVSEF